MAKPWISRSEVSETEGSVRRDIFEKDTFPHLEALYRTAAWFTPRQSLAENLVTTTFVRAYDGWHDSGDRRSSKARLFRILTRETFGFGMRVHQRYQPKEYLSENPGLDANSEGGNGQSARSAILQEQLPLLAGVSDVSMTETMARLRPQSRLMMLLLFSERFSHANIGYITDLGEVSVKAILGRLRRLVPHYLAQAAVLAADAENGSIKWKMHPVRFGNESKTVPERPSAEERSLLQSRAPGRE